MATDTVTPTSTPNVNKSNKRIVINTIMLYVRMFVTMIVGLYTSRIVLRELGVEDYGLNNVVGSLLSLFTFIQGSLSSSASRFLSFELGKGSKGNLNKVFCMTQNIHFIFALIVLIVAETVGLWYMYNKMVIPPGRFHAAMVVYQLSTLSAIFSIFVVPYNAMIIAQERMKAFAYLSIVNVFAQLFNAFMLCITPFDKLITMAVLTFILAFITRSLYVSYCNKYFPEVRFRRVWDKAIFREMFVFSAWSVCSYSRIIIDQASNVMVNAFFGPVVNAARAVANSVQKATYTFAINFQFALNPQIVKGYAAEDKKRVIELVDMSQKVSFSLLYVVMFPLLVNLHFVLNLWLVEVPEYSEQLVVIICLSYLFVAISNSLDVVAEAANRLKRLNAFNVPYYALSLLVAYLVLRMGGSVVAFYATFALFEAGAYLVKLYAVNGICRLPIAHELWLFARVMFTIVASFGMAYLLMQYFPEGVGGFFLKAFVALCFAIAWIAIVILGQRERQMAITLILKKLKIKK